MKNLLTVAFLLMSVVVFAQKTVSKSFTGVKRVVINTSSGDAKIGKSSGNAVEVEVSYMMDEKYFRPSFEQTDDRLEIGEEYHGHDDNSRGSSVIWTLKVPDGIRVNFHTGSGDLLVTESNIDLEAVSGSGNLEFSSVKGTLHTRTGSGNVELANFNGEARVNTGSGDMNVEESQGELDLNCGSGNIRVRQSNATFTVNTGSGDVRAEKVTLAGSSRFNTGSGSAKVGLAATPKFDLKVNSGSGSSVVNFNGNEIVGEISMQASKRYGNISAPFEFDKTVELANGNSRNDVTVLKSVTKGKGTNRIMISTGSGDAILR